MVSYAPKFSGSAESRTWPGKDTATAPEDCCTSLEVDALTIGHQSIAQIEEADVWFSSHCTLKQQKGWQGSIEKQDKRKLRAKPVPSAVMHDHHFARYHGSEFKKSVHSATVESEHSKHMQGRWI